jgi:GWxTD domain-containing protein
VLVLAVTACLAFSGTLPHRQPFITEWLGQEASYIVTDDERQEFRELTADTSRRSFVRQFWLRRGSEFRKEYQRRIAYANQQFGRFGPGWESDRGRAYIILGAPNSVDSQPMHKSEIWRYPEMELRFSGLTPDGDYLLVLPKGQARMDILHRLRLLPPGVLASAAQSPTAPSE